MYEKTLCYVFDLAYLPYSFDIYPLMATMELERIHRNLDAIHLVIIPAGVDRAGSTERTTFSEDEIRWRETHIIIDSIYLLPRIKGYSLFHTREEGFTFLKQFQHCSPLSYQTLSHTDSVPLIDSYSHLLSDAILRWLFAPKESYLSNLQAPIVAERYVEQWCKTRVHDRKLLVVNLREARYWSERNSNIERWVQFCKQIDFSKYAIVILRDFDRNMEPLPDCFPPEALVFSEVVLSQGLRLALYKKAHMVLGDNAGTSMPMLFSPHITCMYFIPHLETSNATILQNLSCNLMYKNKLLFSTPHQLVVLEDHNIKDDLFTIFQKFEKQLQNPKLAAQEYVEHFMLKKKDSIINNDVLWKLLLDLLNTKINHNSIYTCYLLVCRMIQMLPPKRSRKLQIFSYALGKILCLQPNIETRISKDLSALFKALEAYKEGSYPTVQQHIKPHQESLCALFPYPEHWIQNGIENNFSPNTIKTIDEEIKTQDTTTYLRFTCPICLFELKIGGLTNIAFLSYHIDQHGEYHCVQCLHPLKLSNNLTKHFSNNPNAITLNTIGLQQINLLQRVTNSLY